MAYTRMVGNVLYLNGEDWGLNSSPPAPSVGSHPCSSCSQNFKQDEIIQVSYIDIYSLWRKCNEHSVEENLDKKHLRSEGRGGGRKISSLCRKLGRLIDWDGCNCGDVIEGSPCGRFSVWLEAKEIKKTGCNQREVSILTLGGRLGRGHSMSVPLNKLQGRLLLSEIRSLDGVFIQEF